MRALVDRVHFESKPKEGTVVCLEKRLDFRGSGGARKPDAADSAVRLTQRCAERYTK